MSIFIVENEQNKNDSKAKCLNAAGYFDLNQSDSIDKALAMLCIKPSKKHPQISGVELILLDILSITESLELVRLIKNCIQYRDIPIIVVSESSSPEFMQMAFALGAIDFLVKPVSDLELIARVRSSMRLKHEIDRRKARERELTEVTKQLSDLNAWLTKLSLIDSLTRIANRRGFDHSFDQEWRRSIRNHSPISLIMIDVDHFKKYNDSLGHREGDFCLQKVSQAIKDALNRPGDIACRYGGEEFAVVLSETDEIGALKVAERIRKNIEDLKIKHPDSETSKLVTISLGVATVIPTMEIEASTLIESSDKALYKAKNKGRNRTEVEILRTKPSKSSAS